MEARHKIWLRLAQLFLRRCWKSVDDRRTTIEPAYTISSPVSLKGSGELKRRMWFQEVFISALDKIRVDVKNQLADFLFIFLGYGIRM